MQILYPTTTIYVTRLALWDDESEKTYKNGNMRHCRDENIIEC